MPKVGNIFVTEEQLRNPRIRRAFLASQETEEAFKLTSANIPLRTIETIPNTLREIGEEVEERYRRGVLQTGAALETTGALIFKRIGITGLANKLDTLATQDQELANFGIQIEDSRKFREKILDPMFIAGGIAQTLPNFLLSMGVGVGALIAGAPVAIAAGVAFLGTAALEAGFAALDAKRFGADEETVKKTAFLVGIANGLLEVLPIFKLLTRTAGGNTLKRKITQLIARNIVEQSLLEAGTESLQEIVSNSVAKVLYDEQRNVLAGVPESALFGGILGGGVSVVTDVSLGLVAGQIPIGLTIKEVDGQMEVPDEIEPLIEEDKEIEEAAREFKEEKEKFLSELRKEIEKGIRGPRFTVAQREKAVTRAEARGARLGTRRGAVETRMKLLSDLRAKRGTIQQRRRAIRLYAAEILEVEDRGKLLATVSKDVISEKNLEAATIMINRIEARVSKKAAVTRFRTDLKKIDVKKLRPEFRDPVKGLLADVDITDTSDRKLNRLASTIAFLTKDPDSILPAEALDKLRVLDQKQLRDLTEEEIRSINDAINHLVHLNKLKNVMLFAKIRKNADAVKAEALEHIKRKPSTVPEDVIDTEIAIKRVGKLQEVFTVDHLNTETITQILEKAEEYGLGDIVKKELEGTVSDRNIISEIIYQGINEGTTEMLKFRQESDDFIKSNIQFDVNPKNKSWSRYFVTDPKDIDFQTVNLPSGKTIRMTKGERVELILHMQNDDSIRHLLGGGFSFDQARAIVHKLSQEDLDTIVESATLQELQLADAVSRYFNVFSKIRINKVSLELNGFEIAIVLNYIRIKTNPINIKRDKLKLQEALKPSTTMGNFYSQTLEGMGPLKGRIEASNPIILQDIFFTFAEHKKMISAYIGLARPLRNAKELIYDPAFRAEIEKRYGPQYWNSLATFIADIEQTTQSTENIEKLTADLINRADIAILGLNPFVMLKQLVSYMLILTQMDLKFVRAAITSDTKQARAEMFEHSAQLRDRLEGNVSRELGEIGQSGEVRKTFTGKVAFGSRLMAGIRAFDLGAVTRIWNAVKLEVAEKFPGLTEQQSLSVVARRTEQIVNQSQPTFLPKDRSKIGRSASMLTRIFTRFTTQRNKIFNMIIREFERYNVSTKDGEAKGRFMKNIFIMTVVSSLFIEIINEIRRLIFGRKPSTILRFIVGIFASSLSFIYFVGDIFSSLVSKIERGTYAGWDVNSIPIQFLNRGVDAVADTVRAIEQVSTDERYKAGPKKGKEKWKGTAIQAGENAIEVVGLMKGIPVRTVKNFLETGFDLITGGEPEVRKKSRISGTRRTRDETRSRVSKFKF